MLINFFILSFRYFDYLFYVDFEASMADENAQNALRHLKVCFSLYLLDPLTVLNLTL